MYMMFLGSMNDIYYDYIEMIVYYLMVESEEQWLSIVKWLYIA